mmetsp:Transcript_12272/g.29764  ORF Transcript_12272/g.29764 Transcript_12272/m.29764 type:complete len:177 (+) Transcript_12272:134-664(+)
MERYERNKAQKLALSRSAEAYAAFGNPQTFGANVGKDVGKAKQKSLLLDQMDHFVDQHEKMQLDMSNPGSMFLGAGGQQGLGQGAYQLQADQKPESTDIMKNLSRAAIRRMARRGGCKRVSFKIHEESREAMFSFLEKVLADTVTYVHHSKRATVKPRDVVNALKRQGKAIYGFGN